MGIARIDVALSAGGLLAVLPGFDEPLSVQADLQPTAEDFGSALGQAFDRLEESVRTTLRVDAGASPRFLVRAALLPPFCDVRIVELPALRPEETELVLRRDAARHFLSGSRPVVVGVAPYHGSSEKGSLVPVMAAAAPRSVVDALRQAVENRGWLLERIVPGQAGWLSALTGGKESGAGAGHSTRVVVALDGGAAHLIRVGPDGPDLIRKLPANDTPGIVEAAGPLTGAALILGEAATAGGLAQAMKEAGWVVRPAERTSLPDVVAARETPSAGLELVPDFLERVRRERSRGLTGRLLAAAIVILAASAVVHLWGQARALERVRRERADLAPSVSPVLAMRDSLDAINVRLEELRVLGGQSRRWTASLIELVELLPPETHLVSLQAAGDTLVVEASGGRAGEALAAFGASPLLQDVRLEGSIERDLQEGETAGERFSLSAVLAPEAHPHTSDSSTSKRAGAP